MAYFSWMAFLDENNLMVQYKRHRKLKELEKNKDYYSAEIKRVSHELYELSNNPETLEKFAREHYWMKRPDEDVFVLVAQEK
jgi:cell division protein FtsB